MLTPRPYQQRGHDELFKLIDSGEQRICVTGPTGAGKSLNFTMAIQEAMRRNWRVSLYTHRSVLIPQLSDVLTGQGISHGIRASGFDADLDQRIQLSMFQTEDARCMKKRPRWNLHAAKLVLIDEAHGYTAGVTKRIVDHHVEQGAAIAGFTATPVDLWHMYDKLVVLAKNSELRECGAHVPCAEFCPDEPDVAGLRRTKVGEFVEGDVVKKIMVPTIFGRVWEHYKKLNPFRRPGILFGPSVDGSKYFCDEFNSKNVPTAHIDAKQIYYGRDPKSGSQIIESSNQTNRQTLFDRVKAGEIKMVCNRFVLTEGFDCLDSQTEILTVNGWKGIGEVDEGDYLYNFNRETGLMEVDRVDRYMERGVRAGERMVRWKSQHLDIRVTEGHNMLFRYPVSKKRDPRGHDDWRFRKAAEFPDSKSVYSLPLAANLDRRFQPKEMPVTDDELRFIAWVVTDGWFQGGKHKRTAAISQSHKKYASHIRDLLDRLGFDYSESVRTTKSSFDGEYEYECVHSNFSIPFGMRGDKKGYGHLRQYIQKEGTGLWMQMSQRQFAIFWHELILGDGQLRIQGTASRRSPVLTVNNKGLADCLSALAVTRGKACSVGQYTTKKNHQMYYLTVRDKEVISTSPKDSRSTQTTFEAPSPEERVWCVSTSNQTIVTRRNGRIAIMGNCPELYIGIMATMFGSVKMFLQAAGRLLRAHETLDEVVLQDHGGHRWRHGSVNEDRTWEIGDTSKKISAERVSQLERGEEEICGITCPECHYVRLSGPKCHNCGHMHARNARMVVQVDGSLKKQLGSPVKRKKEKPEGLKAWNQDYWSSSKSKSAYAKTFNQLWSQFRRENPQLMPFIGSDQHGRDRLVIVDPKTHVPMPLPFHPPIGDKFLWDQKVRDVPMKDLVK